jgi:hypothetical protein
MRIIKSSIEIALVNEFLLIMYENGIVQFLNYILLPFSKINETACLLHFHLL